MPCSTAEWHQLNTRPASDQGDALAPHIFAGLAPQNGQAQRPGLEQPLQPGTILPRQRQGGSAKRHNDRLPGPALPTSQLFINELEHFFIRGRINFIMGCHVIHGPAAEILHKHLEER
jgi:hypothetical protein